MRGDLSIEGIRSAYRDAADACEGAVRYVALLKAWPAGIAAYLLAPLGGE